MRIDGIQLVQGSNISNLVVASGTAFPSSPDEGELFFRTDSSVAVKGLYSYIGGTWDRLASTDSLTAPTGITLPATANAGDLYYLNTNDVSEGLYAYSGSAWVAVASGGASYTITGDVTGTIDGGTDALTLATVATAGTTGSASTALTITINAKGLTTSVSSTPIAIAASQTTSGTFADARVAQSNVTQHQSALAIAASQTTSGTFADARIAQSSVTQHQAALTVTESQITDGTLLARVGSSETISGTWSFNNNVTVPATPVNSTHAASKSYVDNIAAGVNAHAAVRAATTGNITLSGTQTIDDVAVVTNDRVLVKNQSIGSENGVYVVAAGAWARATDFDGSPSNEVTAGDLLFVLEGTVNANISYVLITTGTIVVGTTALVFTVFSRAAELAAGAGLTRAGNTIDIGTASASRIVVNADNIDLATVSNSGIGSFNKLTTDSYGRVTGTTAVVAGDITALVDATYVNVTGDTMTGGLTINSATGLLMQTSSTTIGSLTTTGSRIRLSSTSGNDVEIVSGQIFTVTAGTSNFGFSVNTAGQSVFATSNVALVNRVIGGGPASGKLTVAANNIHALVGVQRYSADALSGSLVFTKSRSATTGLDSIVSASDTLGAVVFNGSDSSSTTAEGARISTIVDGTPGSLSMPGALLFWTTASGSSNASERMRITSGGDVGIGVTPVAYGSSFVNLAVGSAAGGGIFDSIYAGTRAVSLFSTATEGRLDIFGASRVFNLYVNSSQRFSIDTSGNAGLGTGTLPSTRLAIDDGGQGLMVNLNSSHANGGYVRVQTSGTSIADIGTGQQIITSGPASTWGLNVRTGSLVFATAQTERMRIDGGGMLMINSTAAIANRKFRVENSLVAGGSAPATGDPAWAGLDVTFDSVTNMTNLASMNASTAQMSFWTKPGTASNVAERMRIDQAGQFGIGGVTPGTWSFTARALEFSYPAFGMDGTGQGFMSFNLREQTSGNWFYKSTDFAQLFRSGGSSGWLWSTAPSGTVGTAASLTERMRLTVAGELLVGRSSSSGLGLLQVNGGFDVSSSASLINYIRTTLNTGYSSLRFYNDQTSNVRALEIDYSGSAYATSLLTNGITGEAASIATTGSYPLMLGTNNTARLTISSSGEILVGMTATGNGRMAVDGTAASVNTAIWGKNSGGAATAAAVFWNATTTGDSRFIEFYTEGTATLRGNIDFNRAGTAVRYNTSSDARLKKDIVDAPSASTLIDAVQVRSFGWKDSDSRTDYGFVAQELVTVVPDAVSQGDAGEVVEKAWAVDYSKLVPMLVKEIQELRARVAALEAK